MEVLLNEILGLFFTSIDTLKSFVFLYEIHLHNKHYQVNKGLQHQAEQYKYHQEFQQVSKFHEYQTYSTPQNLLTKSNQQVRTHQYLDYN